MPVESLGIPAPDCTGLPDYGDHQDGGVLSPGIYGNINVITGTLVLEPGLYCLSGSFNITGGSVTGEGVTIYSQGDFTSTADAAVNLQAPASIDTPSEEVTDVLLYLGANNTADIRGTENSIYTGTIFGLGEDSLIVVVGTGMTLNAQLIAGTVHIVPLGTVYIDFDLYHGYPNKPFVLALQKYLRQGLDHQALQFHKENMKLLIGTRNPAKFDRYRKILAQFPNLKVLSLDDFPGLPTIQEDGLAASDNARKKARGYAAASDLSTLSIDEAMTIPGLPDAEQPGTYLLPLLPSFPLSPSLPLSSPPVHVDGLPAQSTNSDFQSRSETLSAPHPLFISCWQQAPYKIERSVIKRMVV